MIISLHLRPCLLCTNYGVQGDQSYRAKVHYLLYYLLPGVILSGWIPVEREYLIRGFRCTYLSSDSSSSTSSAIAASQSGKTGTRIIESSTCVTRDR